MTSKNNKAPWTAIPNMNLHPKNSDIFHGDGRDPKVGWLGLDSKKLAPPSSHSLREPASVTIQQKGTDPKLGWLGFDRIGKKLLYLLRMLSQHGIPPASSAKIATGDMILTKTRKFVRNVVVWSLLTTRAILGEVRVRMGSPFRIRGDRENRLFLGGDGN